VLSCRAHADPKGLRSMLNWKSALTLISIVIPNALVEILSAKRNLIMSSFVKRQTVYVVNAINGILFFNLKVHFSNILNILKTGKKILCKSRN
jgi:hypothetical protein